MNWKWLWDWLGVLKVWKDGHGGLTGVGGGRGQLARWVRGGEGAWEAGGRARGAVRTRGWWPAAGGGLGERRGGVIGGGGGETQFRGGRLRRRGRVAVRNWHTDSRTRGEVGGEIVKIVVSGGHEVLLGRRKLRKIIKSGLEKIVWTWIENSVEVCLWKRIIKRTFPIHRTSSV